MNIKLGKSLTIINDFFDKNYLYIVFLLSLASVVGSLYYSNIIGIDPCELCWWARILIYPLLPISAICLILNIKLPKAAILSLTIPGMFLTGFHYSLQKFGFGKGLIACPKTNPCEIINIQYLNFITIPLMAFLAFLTINTVIFLSYKFKKA